MMASTEGTSEDAGASASSQGDDAPKSRNASLKRKTTEPKDQKLKNKRRTARPGYTVHEGEDMLLIISGSTSQSEYSARAHMKKQKKKEKKGGTVKKKKSKSIIHAATVKIKEEVTTPVFWAKNPGDHRWGQSLPEEVLVNIFKMVVTQDGAVPFLCRVGRVCRLWNAAAATPVLWRKVSVGYCWIAPSKSQLPNTQLRIKNTLDWLAQNRFSQLREFSLHHWNTNVDYAVDMVSQFCPHLSALKLSYCTNLTEAAFQSLGRHCSSLRSLNLQYTEFQVEGLLTYLENHGAQIRQIWFTHGLKYNRLLTAITRGCCPHLEFLEVNTNLDRKDGELHISIQALQMACPELKTFRMLNVRLLLKNSMRNGAESSEGFPLLEELCIATTSYSYVTDSYLLEILFGSPRLRVLDLRGCSRVTSAGLVALPCHELECLFWGQYFSSHAASSSVKKGLQDITQKWSHTLRQLDVANQLFPEEDLELAMCHLAHANDANTLQWLNLSGTRITPTALRPLIGQTTALDYLNLSSCRNLPRGLKRIYRGQEDIRQLLDKLE